MADTLPTVTEAAGVLAAVTAYIEHTEDRSPTITELSSVLDQMIGAARKVQAVIVDDG